MVVLGVLGGLFAVVSMMISAFGDVAYVPAAERATMLSQGIRDAFTYGLVGGGTVAVLGGMLTAVGLRGRSRTLRRRASAARPSAAE